jgi:hypothetical protein
MMTGPTAGDWDRHDDRRAPEAMRDRLPSWVPEPAAIACVPSLSLPLVVQRE